MTVILSVFEKMAASIAFRFFTVLGNSAQKAQGAI
jgi:hypothetical protein